MPQEEIDHINNILSCESSPKLVQAFQEYILKQSPKMDSTSLEFLKSASIAFVDGQLKNSFEKFKIIIQNRKELIERRIRSPEKIDYIDQMKDLMKMITQYSSMTKFADNAFTFSLIKLLLSQVEILSSTLAHAPVTKLVLEKHFIERKILQAIQTKLDSTREGDFPENFSVTPVIQKSPQRLQRSDSINFEPVNDTLLVDKMESVLKRCQTVESKYKRSRSWSQSLSRTISFSRFVSTKSVKATVHLSTDKRGNVPAEEFAATMIQATWKGYKCRLEFRLHQNRKWVVKDILESESNYLKCLCILNKHFFSPLCRKLENNEGVLSKKDIDTLFFKLNELSELHCAFLDKIYETYSKWTVGSAIADVFQFFLKDISIYIDYISNQFNAMKVFDDNRANPLFQQFLSAIKSKVLKFGTLTELLLIPVHRIPKYIAFIHRLVERTPIAHSENLDLSHILDRLLSIEKDIEELKKEIERINILTKLQQRISEIPFTLNTSDRTFIQEFQVTEKAKKNERVCHMFLFTDLIICAIVSKSMFMDRTLEYKWDCNIHEVDLFDEYGKSITICWKWNGLKSATFNFKYEEDQKAFVNYLSQVKKKNRKTQHTRSFDSILTRKLSHSKSFHY